MEAKRIRDAGNREAVLLAHENVRVVIDADKGMVPELSTRSGNGWINAHWQPWFRANSGERWDDAKHAPFWKVPLLYDIAGNFPCAPNFGPAQEAAGYALPPHGETSRRTWTQSAPGLLDNGTGAFMESRLPEGNHPFRYGKTDLILQGQAVHYTKLEIENTGAREEPYNCGWHNTVGAPFLESGCLIDNNAAAYAVPPEGTEFDTTGELAFGAQRESLEGIPLRKGGSKDMRQVRGITGYTDFITGAVPRDCTLGWSSIVNPRLKRIYLSFFPGPAAVTEREIPLYFFDLWMNYGGRPYQPWAAQDGLTDRTFCLGAENATGYFANGLGDALKNPTLLGNPSYLRLPPGESRVLWYGTLFDAYPGDALDRGVRAVHPDEKGLIVEGYAGKRVTLRAEGDFKTLRSL